MRKKKLIILTDNFGLNFSGGAIATCRIMETIQDEFAEVILIGKKVGLHNFKRFSFLEYQNKKEAIAHIRRIPKEEAIFYGDFYMAYYFIQAEVPFFFTYHDNWPEQQQFGWANWRKSFFYVPIYKWIFRKASWVVTVSNYKYAFTKKYTTNTSIIRNGINAKITKNKKLPIPKNGKVRIVMLGNIDDRKYGWAVPLFQKIAKEGTENSLQIDIYGNTNDLALENSLKGFPFVQLKGFCTNVDFSEYHLFLTTSKIENLSISVCEALQNHTPVLSFDVGGHKEVIQHKKTGMLVPPGRIEEMFTAINQAVSGNQQFDFSEQDLSDFNWQLAGKAYLHLFNKHAS